MAKKSEIYHPTKENKSFASIFFCRQTFTVIAISFAPCSIILSISLGVTNEESCSIIAKHLRETSESETIKSVKNRTLKIKQRRDKKEPDKIKRVLSVLVS